MTMRQLSDKSLHELQSMLRWWRGLPKHTIDALSSDLPIGPYYTRLFRTQGDNPASLTDATYPTQVDGSGVKLPGKWLTVNTTTFAYDVVGDSRDNWIYSPGGWIPRLTVLRCCFAGGVWMPYWVPQLPVRFDGNVTAPNTVTVEMINSGDQDTQTFTAHLDFMAGTSSASTNEEAFAWLNEQTQQWELINRECP